MIWVLLFSLIFGSGGEPRISDTNLITEYIQEWNIAVQTTVLNVERKSRALNELNKISEETRQFRGEMIQALAHYYETDQRYTATMEDYEAANAEVNRIWDKYDKAVADRRFAVKEALLDREWESVISVVDQKVDKLAKKAVKTAKKARKKLKKGMKKQEKKEAKGQKS
jgi:hypothetical protein